MKITVLQENLVKAVNATSRFATSRAQLPVLGNIKFSTKKTKLLVASTNLEVSVSVSLGAQIEEEGEITIPAKVIADIVSNLSSGTISLETDKEQLKISSSGFSSNVSGMNASDFPDVPQKIDEKKSLSLPQEEFINSLSQVSFATSVDETRPILTGVLFLFGKDRLTLVGTDGFRLSQKTLNIKGIEKRDPLVLPKNILMEISRMVGENENILFEFNQKENQVVLGINDTVLSSRILEGEFPDYEKIIPKSSNTKVSVDKEEFLRGVKLASVFARDSANIVKLTINKDSLSLSAESQSVGTQKTKIDAKVEGEGLEIAFNYRFLEEFLHSVKGEDIKIEFSSSSAPGVFTDPSDTNYLHLIMPVKIQS